MIRSQMLGVINVCKNVLLREETQCRHVFGFFHIIGLGRLINVLREFELSQLLSLF